MEKWNGKENVDKVNEMTIREREKEETGNEEEAGRMEKNERWRRSHSR